MLNRSPHIARSHRRRGLALMLCAALLASPLRAAVPPDEMVSVNMRDADVVAVTQWVAELSGKHIIIDPRVKGPVTVLASDPMPARQVYEVYLAMLDVYGYAATESNGILRVFPASLAPSSPAELVGDFNQTAQGQQIVYVLQAGQLPATRLATLLKPLVPPTGYLGALSENNSLVIADEAANVKRLVALAQRMEQAGDVAMQSIALQHASAKSVVSVVESLVEKNAENPFNIVSDERSNSVLMSGDETTRQRVAALIATLDKPLRDTGSTRVVQLKYQSAKELAPLLSNMAKARQEESKDANTSESAVSVEASESNNALVLTAPPALINEMLSVIDQIDVRQQQVHVEAIIAEVSDEFAQTLGVEWNTSLSASEGVEAGTNFGLKTFDQDGELNLIGQGLSIGFFHNGSLRALVRAMANDTGVNVLSTPSITTVDNHEARILVGSNAPFKTGESTGGASTTTDPFVTFERKDIGITLNITPQINSVDSVTLEILQEIESITESTLVTDDIVTNKRSIDTKVIVDNESVLVLGGLITDEAQETVEKVPFFGDLPLLGALFRTTTEKSVRRNLMVFIHPTILASDQSATEISRNAYKTLQDLQKRYHNDELIGPGETTEMSDFEQFKPRKGSEL